MRRHRAIPPEKPCRGDCGRKKRTWASSWLCRFCLLAEREASPLSMREWRKQNPRRDSAAASPQRCSVCGETSCYRCSFVDCPLPEAPATENREKETA